MSLFTLISQRLPLMTILLFIYIYDEKMKPRNLIAWTIKKTADWNQSAAFFVVLEGLEPSLAEPESDVLPLHHKTMYLQGASASASALFPRLRVQS